MNFESKRATKLLWPEVARLVEAEIYKVLGKEIRCSARSDENTYWAVQFHEYIMPLSEVYRLLEAVTITEDGRQDTLPSDGSTTVKSIGMDLAMQLLKKAMGYCWETILIEENALWLLGKKHLQTEADTVITVDGKQINLKDLKSRNDLIAFFNENGPTHTALMDFCNEYREKYHNELCWPYPISDGRHLGTFLVLVQEGILSLPYDDADKVDYELFCMDDIAMFDAESMMEFMASWQSFAADLWEAMEAMKNYLLKKEKQSHE